MNTRTKNILHTSVIVITVAVVMVIARQGFAWTNPAGAPPFSSPTITTVGGNVGIGTSAPGVKLSIDGNTAWPAISGTAQNGGLRIGYTTGNATLDIGSTPGTGSWLQATNKTDLSLEYPLILNPNGGVVGIGTITPDANYKLTTSGGGVKAENSSATQPAGYFSNAGGAAALTVGTGGLTLGGVNQTSWPVSGGQWTTSGANIYNSNAGNVGIGVTSPLGLLHIGTTNGLVYFGAGVDGVSNALIGRAGGASFHVTGTAIGDLAMRPEATKSIVFGTTPTAGTVGVERMRITNAGNVGIGTSAPAQKLHVVGSGHMATFEDTSAAANGVSEILIKAGTATSYLWTANQNSTSWGGANSLNIYAGTGGAMTLWTNATEKVRITTTGNVGIGTTAPANKLDVNGSAIIGDPAYTYIYLRDDESTSGPKSIHANSNVIGFLNGVGSWQSYWDNSGNQYNSGFLNLGGNLNFVASNPYISASSYFIAPGGAYFNGGTVYFEAPIQARGGIHDDTNTNLSINGGTSGNTYFSGNVGVGIVAPAKKLEVSGDIIVNSVTVGRGSGSIWTNAAVGSSALISNTSGNANTAMGANSQYFTTTGTNNTSSGYNSLFSNTTGTYNTANGSEALYANTTGNGSTASGVQALYFNNTGTYNTANGMYALRFNTTGTYNTANGAQALYSNTTGWYNVASGLSALYSNTAGTGNVAIGHQALFGNFLGTYNTAVGYGANVTSGSLTNATAIGNTASVGTSNTVRIGNTFVTRIEGQVGWSATSDVRSKHDIVDSDLGLGFINKLRPVSYKLNNGDGGINYGFIAQEVEGAVGKKTNIVLTDNTPEGMKSMRYDDLIAPMVKAIQEQQKQIEDLREEVRSKK